MELDRWDIAGGVTDILGSTLCRSTVGSTEPSVRLGYAVWGGGDWSSLDRGRKVLLWRCLLDRAGGRSRSFIIAEANGGCTTWSVVKLH